MSPTFTTLRTASSPRSSSLRIDAGIVSCPRSRILTVGMAPGAAASQASPGAPQLGVEGGFDPGQLGREAVEQRARAVERPGLPEGSSSRQSAAIACAPTLPLAPLRVWAARPRPVLASGWEDTTMKVKVVVHEAEEGGYWAEVPALPGCATQGESFEELLQNLYEAIEGCLAVDVGPIQATGKVRVLEIAV